MLTYHTFRNTDPPVLTDIWRSRANEPGRVATVTTDLLELLIFSKPYFDYQGLIVARDEGRAVGFVHAGFGADEEEDGVSTEMGTTCMILVRPDCDEQAVAGGLLERSEAYLRASGAQVIYGGAIRPLNAFYLGLYGGSELPGVLGTDYVAKQAFTSHGYREIDRTLLFERDVSSFEAVVDRRQMQIRRQMVAEVVVDFPTQSWWDACTLGNFDLTRFQLVPKTGGTPVATATFRTMELNVTSRPESIGLIDVWVEESSRRRGLAMFLLSEAFRQFLREGIKRVEVRAMQHNLPAHMMYRKLGFQQTGEGSVYRKE
jgi:GNAT superfamily N-acetyltransferase